jgi:hypothetical protein
VTGATVTGLTSPTYTLTSDTPPFDVSGEQHAVTALGGTQTDVDAHTVSAPFTMTMTRPKQFKVLGTPNPVTGVISQVPMNTYKLIGRKGVTPLDGQPTRVARATVIFDVPAGADENDAQNIRALVSCLIGILNDQSSGIADTLINGVL